MTSIWRPKLWIPDVARRLWTETDGGGRLQGLQCGSSEQCGCENCSIFTDDFNRADNTDLGADWSEVSGSWSISSNTLSTASTSGLCIHDNGNSAADMSVVATITGPSGSFGRIIAGYQDTSNYWFAEVKFGASGTGRFDLYQRSGGANTLKDGGTLTVTPDVAHRVTLCIQFGEGSNLDTISAFIELTGGYSARWSQHTLTTQDGCGVGTGSTVGAGVVFDSFSVTRAGGSCPDCIMPCSACDGGGDAPHAFDVYIPPVVVRTSPGCTTCASFGDQIYRVYQCGDCKYIGDAGSCTFGSTTYNFRVALWLTGPQLWFYSPSTALGSDSSVCGQSGFDPSVDNHFSQFLNTNPGGVDCFDTDTAWILDSRFAPGTGCWVDTGSTPYTVPVL